MGPCGNMVWGMYLGAETQAVRQKKRVVRRLSFFTVVSFVVNCLNTGGVKKFQNKFGAEK